jgi:2',3'-cyclic-nucleotide 2'-phosphodiesterase (5'-nucleotidase family)
MAANYTLQILHGSDFEAGLAAVERAPRFAAIVDLLEETQANSITLSSGDNFIPSPFLNAEGDPALAAPLRAAVAQLLGVPADQVSTLATDLARVDMAILSAIGVEASVFGNHEFDLGTTVLANAIDFTANAAGRPTWTGPLFPYLSANLDFSGDAALRACSRKRCCRPKATPPPPPTSPTRGGGGRAAHRALDHHRGERRDHRRARPHDADPGEHLLTGGVQVKDPAGDGDVDNTDELAQVLQPYVDRMTAQGIDKIVLLSHLQQYQLELELAPKLSGVDVVIAGGSHALWANDSSALRPGDAPAEGYPVFRTGADGGTVAVVNTSSEYSYVGRLIVGFDANGNVVREETGIGGSGAYATTDEVVSGLWGNADPYAAGTRGGTVRSLTTAVDAVIDAKDGDVYGFTDVYLDGRRQSVRTQETNFGSLTSDANLDFARSLDPTVAVSIKNGGGIRAEIGTIGTDAVPQPLPPQANPDAGKPEGGISRLDIENGLRFNNGLSLVTVTAEGLKQVLETAVSGVAPGATPGAFPQVAGLEFSFDPSLPAGGRVRNLALVDEAGQPTDVLVQDGAVAGDAARPVRLVTLNFLADGGDGYPLNTLGTDRRDLFNAATTADFTVEGREQQVFADYLAAEFGTPDAAFDVAETPPELDARVQNLAFRADTVLEGAGAVGGPPMPPAAAGREPEAIDWNELARIATANFEASGIW